MHVHFEESCTTRSDCSVQALSWMGKVPESCVPNDDGWKMDYAQYYQEGWLASGNAKGIIGVTFTACHFKKNYESPSRTNFNLRGHRNEVALVKWNEPYQKLATCDINGVIFVWIKHEGRWSIELINDRNSQVTDFSWSHDGRMALICYRDGFVLVGSVAGQRYWSSMLNLDNSTITCGLWTPDDSKVMFGTSDGQVIVMTSNGAMLAQVTVQDSIEVTGMCWSGPKFFMEEKDPDDSVDKEVKKDNTNQTKTNTLAISFKNGTIHLMTNYDDVCPKVIQTGLTGLRVDWSNDGDSLAVAGFIRQANLDCSNQLHFYSTDGRQTLTINIPAQPGKPASAVCWGHNDRRLFVAVGCHIFTAWVFKRVPILQYLCCRTIQRALKDQYAIQKTPLPTKLRHTVATVFSSTIKGYIPDPFKLREFICVPPPNNERLHCTMIRHGDESSGGYYTLYLEYLGGLIPLMKGKRASKLRPEFVIFDPKIRTGTKPDEDDMFASSSSPSPSDSDSDNDIVVEGCGSPRMQRKKRLKKLRERMDRRQGSVNLQRPPDELLYDDNLPETNKLVEVMSNIWGTKFKIHGLASFLPEDLGQVLYKTSLLHLQPRQMTVSILELSGDLCPKARDPSYNPNAFSESDDELTAGQHAFQNSCVNGAKLPTDNIAPVSPEPLGPHPARLAPRTAMDNGGTHFTNGAMEVPVVIEKHPFFPTRTDKSGSSESRSLDGSPPQRRSPSLKSHSLSPAEQVTYSGYTVMDGNLEGMDCFTREMYLHQGAIPKPGGRNTMQQACEHSHCGRTHPSTSIAPEMLASGRDVLVLAAQRLREEVQLQESKENLMAIQHRVPPTYTGDRVVELHEVSPNGELILPGRLDSDLVCWASKACQEIKYIDDDVDDGNIDSGPQSRSSVYDSSEDISARDLMRSQMLLYSDQLSAGWRTCSREGPSPPYSLVDLCHQSIPGQYYEPDQKKLVLTPSDSSNRVRRSSLTEWESSRSQEISHQREINLAYALGNFQERKIINEPNSKTVSCEPSTTAPSKKGPCKVRRGSLELKCQGRHLEVETIQSASLPTSPVHKVVGPTHKRGRAKQDGSLSKHKIQSPMARPRMKSYKAVESCSSDDEVFVSAEEITTSENYKNLETFQKAQLKQKLRKVRTKGDGERERRHSPKMSPILPRTRRFVMHNKAPLWNENSQVYQLDFGGRVTQESAKNFQIEFKGKQVMQFGRIDGHAYTLDFQYPFCATQAFAVALANVTQRLK